MPPGNDIDREMACVVLIIDCVRAPCDHTPEFSETTERIPVTTACNIPQLDEASFQEAVLASPRPVFVHFAERDCEGCEMERRCLEDLVEQAHGRVECFCVHRAKNAGVAARYRVERCPTILVFREGRVARRLVGLSPPGELEIILRTEFRSG